MTRSLSGHVTAVAAHPLMNLAITGFGSPRPVLTPGGGVCPLPRGAKANDNA
ncbi:hypothetical protein ACQPZP_33390 [Spirillospora sp. CA-142024]|uniref:hypothetical protein n=1 Tax=Spirillospora sp. CA-142024 TaxID=3240036 RepID=UPI003D92E594